MTLSKRVKGLLPDLLPLFLALPDNQFIDLTEGGVLQFQCSTQDAVAAVRQHFPGTIWKKRHSSGGDWSWWEYDAVWRGIKIHIYACREAPPTCKMIEEEVEVEVSVPVAYETRKEVRRVTRWECPEEKAEGGSPCP